jgi:MFS family permease
MNDQTINAKKLFLGARMSLVATSVSFAAFGAIMGTLKTEFLLSNAQVGLIGGAQLYGFAISQLILSPLCDNLGMKRLLQLAFIGHVVGVLTMIFASGFWMLYAGALLISMGNGAVEAACNPLVVTIFPEQKAVKLNQFHVWFPGGIVLGGVMCWLMDQVGVTSWQLKLALVLIPAVLYAYLLFREHFPKTESTQAGISMLDSVKATFTTPLMLLMLVCMAVTASSELGPNRWVPAVLESGGIVKGILVLVWINGLMALLRYNAGAFIHRFSPTAILLISSVLAVIGLYGLSVAESGGMIFLTATIFAVGVCFFWPMMLSFVSERIPQTGAFGLGLMGAMGMAVVGLFTAPKMGDIADQYLHQKLEGKAMMGVIAETKSTFPALIGQAQGALKDEVRTALTDAEAVETAFQATGKLPEGKSAGALREIIAHGGTGDAAKKAADILNPADNYGGRMAFRAVVPFTAALILVFGFLYLNDRKKGGYKVEKLNS